MDASSSLRPSERARLSLEAQGRPGLFSLLSQSQGAVLGERFVVGELVAVGGQMLVFSGLDQKTQEVVAIKQAAFDYQKMIRYGRKEAALLRENVSREHQVLSACTSGHMPRPIALLQEKAIIPAARGARVLGEGETYSVQEWISAPPLSQSTNTYFALRTPQEREETAAFLTKEFLLFWEELQKIGWLYVDVSASNLHFCWEERRLRVVDAGSAVAAAEKVLLSGMAPAFATPKRWEAFSQKRPLPAKISLVLPLWAKVLHFFLTRQEPWNASLPDLSSLSGYSSLCSGALQTMLEADAYEDERPVPEIGRWISAFAK